MAIFLEDIIIPDILLVFDVSIAFFVVVMAILKDVFWLIPILNGVFICHIRFLAVYRLTEVLAPSLVSLRTTLIAIYPVSL